MKKLFIFASCLLLVGCAGVSGGGTSAQSAPLTQEELNRRLHIFANRCYEDGVYSVLNHGADPNMRFRYGSSVLDVAASNGCVEVVRMLIESGARVNASDDKGRTALMSAAYGNYLGVFHILLGAGADVNAQDIHGWTPLMWAVQQSNNGIANQLLLHDADLTPVNDSGDTALGIALDRRDTEMVQLLQSYGASR